MIDSVQLVLLVVIVVLSLLLVILGIQVFLILRELRNTIKKTNKVLDHAVRLRVVDVEAIKLTVAYDIDARLLLGV